MNRLSVEEIENMFGMLKLEYPNIPKRAKALDAVLQQLTDTMCENERLRDTLWRIAGNPGAATTDESPELKCGWYEAIASKALSNKDSEHG